MTGMKFDIIRTVEACYSGVKDDAAWLKGVLDSLRPLDNGPASYAELYRFDDRNVLRVECSALRDCVPAALLRVVHDLYASLPPDGLRRLFAPAPPVEYILKRAGRAGGQVGDAGRGHLQQWRMEDTLWIVATEPDGRVALLAMTTAAGCRRLAPRTLHQLARLSAHLSSAVRLRAVAGLAAQAHPEEGAEAVLDTAGRVVHAAGEAQPGEARRSLTEAVRRMDRARGTLRRSDPEEALALWQGLVDGRWSLVDQCDSDGKRYLLARRNEPGVRDPVALTARERSVLAFAAMGHQNKHVGYLLGISAAAVAAHLESLKRKLRLRSRLDLIQRFAPLAHAGAAQEAGWATSTASRTH